MKAKDTKRDTSLTPAKARLNARLEELALSLEVKIARMTMPRRSAPRKYVNAPAGVPEHEDTTMEMRGGVTRDASWRATEEAQRKFYYALCNALVDFQRNDERGRILQPGFFVSRAPRLRHDVEEALDKYYAACVAYAKSANTATPSGTS